MPKKKKAEDAESEPDDALLTEEKQNDIEFSDSDNPVENKSDDDLTLIPGVGPANAIKLKTAGFDSFMAVAAATPKMLCDVEGISKSAAAKIISEAKKLANIGDFLTIPEFEEKRKGILRLTTGSRQIDSLFGGGGLETMSITEFFGEFGSGKTQMCFQLAVNATQPIEKGGLDGHVLVIDTENTFKPIRITQIATAMGLDVEEVRKKIHVARAYNSSHQMILLQDKAYEMAKKFPIKLLIVDSLTAHFRSEYIGRGSLGERQGLLNKHMHDLLKFGYLNNTVIAVTNQVLSNPQAFFGDPLRPVGGNIVGHTSTYRVYMRKVGMHKRVVRMVDSPENPQDEVQFTVDVGGIHDG